MTDPIRIGPAPIPAPAAPAPAAASHKPPQQAVEANVDALVLSGVVERSAEPFPGWKVTMHTLTNSERVLAAKGIPNNLLDSAAASQEAIKLPTLVQSITFIELNGVKKNFDKPEDKAELSRLLDTNPAILVDVLYMEYCKMVNDLIVLVETGVKKN